MSSKFPTEGKGPRLFLERVEKPQKKPRKKASSQRKFPGLLRDAPTYAEMVPLYELWSRYMEKLLDGCAPNDERLMKADYHGCLLSVGRSRNASLEGVSGIVARESRNAFFLVSAAGLRCVPKAGTEFRFVLRGHLFLLFGDNFRLPPEVRIQKKFRSTVLPRLLSSFLLPS